MKAATIGIVDDDANIRRVLEAYLQKEGYHTVGMGTAEEGLEYLIKNMPELWVLDIMLPGMDGYDFCREIRKRSDVPIIFISAKDEEVDKVLGLELGSDDYLTKPFSPRELVARVKRHLHRWYTLKEAQNDPSAKALNIDQLKIDLRKRLVFWRGQEIQVTNKEFQFVELLTKNADQALSRESILDHIWGNDYFGNDRAVDDLVKRIRGKMKDFPLETVRGYGYRLRLDRSVEK
ncbi:two-component system response regulator CssR [Scopulibacillus daqui]|uniref:Two-component system response regulator CssR n=1 Tax=Scopulibacillus daqui TaxID=1469162 RepID=A0ABS2Q343_9BACL|nr:response regulator transcription factor [Scopulibacillus daqui]MBM7646536.1 two-component system response regulator CssR [Scopulibacillus daqui]